MNHCNLLLDAMCVQAPTFEKSGIRFPEDTPVIIPSLQKALKLLSQQDEDPHVFQTLIYFFSTLLAGPCRSQSVPDHVIVDVWRISQRDLANPYHFCNEGIQACKWFDAIINQLDPVSTCQEMRQYASVLVRHSSPMTARFHVGAEYTIISRAHDWVVRCAFELGIPYKWKSWLQLMYEKQPYKILDEPSTIIDEDEDVFLATLHAAANIGGFDAMIPVIKFWLRQVLTMVQVWDVCLQVRGDADALMPSYDWCVAAYEQTWHRFKNELQNPLSEYPYVVREQLLRDVHYMRVFEECWKWTDLATQGIKAQDFDPYVTRTAIYLYVIKLVRDEFQPHNLSTEETLEQVFGARTKDNEYLLLAESPIVSVDKLQNDLRLRPSIYDGLCQEFYPDLPTMTNAEYDAMYPDSEAEYDEDEFEPIPLEDVELVAFGPRIDIADLTHTKKPDADDFCTICQEQITLGEPDALRCVVPVVCSDTFHAECLETWVNSTAKICNTCPHCKARMTKYQRPVRAIHAADEE
jgi:hypothetical protein